MKTKNFAILCLVSGLFNGILCLFVLTFEVRLKFPIETPPKKLNCNNETNLSILHCETTQNVKQIKITSTTNQKNDINDNLSLNNQVL